MDDKKRLSKTKIKTDPIPSSLAPDFIKASQIKERQNQKITRKPGNYTSK